MRRGRFRHVVELSLLKSVRSDFLVAFLRPFAAELDAAGLALPKKPSISWLTDLAATLNCDGPVLPASLQAALVDLAELATPLGHEQIMALAEERGMTLVPADETIPQEDLAFLVYLKERELFLAARNRIKFFEARLFAHYHGRQLPLPSAREDATTRLTLLRDRLVSWLRKRNRTGACEVRVKDLDEQMVFSITHGTAPTRAPDVDPGAVVLAERVPEQHDIIVFDKREDRLSVSARLPSEREFYRGVFGFVLFLDEAYFRVVRLYHARPLRERGSGALDVTGIDGLERVTLKRLSFLGTDRHHSKMEVTSDDLRDWLDRRKTRMLLRQRRIGSWTLGFQVRHDAGALDVDVWPPNQLRVDRRLQADLVHRFLQARGFEYRSGDADDPPSSR